MMTATCSMVTVVDHPQALMALSRLRDEKTDSPEFRRQTRILATPLLLAATQGLTMSRTIVHTLLGEATGYIHDTRVVGVPVLRAGLALAEVFQEQVPAVVTHHLGIARDEQTALPERYYPKNARTIFVQDYVVLLDPMLATGGSANDALEQIYSAGGKNIRLVCVVAAKAGINAVQQRFPNVPIYTVAIDPELNGDKYIVPGLGDFGDRYFGTC